MAGSTLGSTVLHGITLGSGAYPSPLTITSTGAIAPVADGAVGLYATVGAGYVLNQGGIAGGAGGAGVAGTVGGTGGLAVELAAGTLRNDGAIAGGAGGIGGSGSVGTHNASAGIGGAGGTGVDIAASTLTNLATIAGGAGGAGGGGSVGVAGGTGGAGGVGVDLVSGSAVNSGLITGGGGGTISLLSAVAGAGGVGAYILSGGLTNTGTIVGGAGGNGLLALPAGPGGAGVRFASGGTLTDAGFIVGGAGAGAAADAVYFGGGASRLILDPGASFSGTVVAVAADSNVLELATGSTTGTLGGGIGGEYLGFANVVVDAGAIWTLSVANTLSAGGSLTVVGSLINAGAISAAIGSTGTVANGTGSDIGGTGGTGGDAVYLAGGGLTNNGTITGGMGGGGGAGGAGGLGGTGGSGAYMIAGTLTNLGTITGGVGGIGGTGILSGIGGVGGTGVDIVAGNLGNFGSIVGGSAGHFGSGDLPPGPPGPGGVGVLFQGGGTLVDAGFIGGGVGGPGTADAVDFGTGASRLILDPGASFYGAVVANTLFSTVLELTSAGNAGTLVGGLGPEYQGFTSVIVDADARWVLVAVNTVVSGSTLVVDAGTTLALDNTLLIDADGSVANGGTIAGVDASPATGGDGEPGADGVAAIQLAGDGLSNTGVVSGGAGGTGGLSIDPQPGGDGGSGGLGIYVGSGSLTNGGMIAGGSGGAGGTPAQVATQGGNGGIGGTALDFAAGTFVNDGTLIGGAGGVGAKGNATFPKVFDGSGGIGGVGLVLNGGSASNAGAILAGAGGAGAASAAESVKGGYGGAGGTAVDLEGGSLTNTGAISGGNGGSSADGDAAGTGGIGIYLLAGSLTNSGIIAGGAVGAGGSGLAAGGAGVYVLNGRLTNTAIISGGTGTIGGVGVLLGNGGTLTTAGAIGGGNGSDGGGYAVYFRSAAGRLILDPGASFSGRVVASKPFDNVMELAGSGATAGTLSGGIGGEYLGFESIVVDAGATWTLSAENAFPSGDLTVDGSLINDGAVVAGTGAEGVGASPNVKAGDGTGGGSGVDLTSGKLTNNGTLTGGSGGMGGGDGVTGDIGGTGGAGGSGAESVLGSVTNASRIVGGVGGVGGDGGFAGLGGNGGVGGAGVGLQSGTLNNAGTIVGGVGGQAGTGNRNVVYGNGGTGGAGVYLTAGSVTNTGTIIGGGGGVAGGNSGGPGGVGVLFNGAGTLTDAGVIGGGTGAGGIADAVDFANGASRLILDPGAVFSGAVVANAGFANVLELATGSRAATLGGGIGAEYQGFNSVVVDASAHWTLSGTNAFGVGDSLVVEGSLTNVGTIQGGPGDAGGRGGFGVDLAGGSLTNQGLIVAGNGGAGGEGGAGVYGAAGGLTNLGTIIGGAAGQGDDGGAGVRFIGGGTLTDGGAIGGGSGAGGSGEGDAVMFGTGASRLILDPGASLGGAVVADAAFSNVLELASAVSAGTLSGLGSAFQGFGSIVVNVGAHWVLQGENAIEAGTTLLGAGDRLDISGGGAVVEVTGTGSLLDNTGEFIVGDGGLGSLLIGSDGTVITTPGTAVGLAGAVIANQSGASGSLVNVSGAGSEWQVNGGLVVGDAGAGSLNITACATVIATTLDLGSQAASSGVVSISGDNSTLITTGSLAVGDAGSGELLVLNGADATIGGDLDIATSGGSGNIDIDGTAGTLTIGGNIVVGATGAAVLTIGLNSTLTQDAGGVIAGTNFTENVYGNLDPLFSGGGSVNILTTKTVAYSAYVSNTTFNISPGVAFTLQSPTIYGATSLNIGQTGDNSGSELTLNVGSFAAASSVTFNDPMSTLVIGIDNLATIDVPPSGTSNFTPEPNPKLGDLLLGDFDGKIKNFQQGDTIDVDTYLSSASAGTLSVNGTVVSVIDIANSATLGVLTFDSATNAAAAVADDAITLVPCFAVGTRISTEHGEVAVEAIAVGDRVKVLLGGGPDGCSEVIWVGQREVDCARHPTPRKVWPVRVSADAFGPGRPGTDLFLSPDHAVYVEGVLIPIRHLVNGSTIVQVPVARVTYHHVELVEHDVLLAEGLPAESFLDMRDGTNYANRTGSVRLYPDFSARMWEAFGCARLVVTGRELEAARTLLAVSGCIAGCLLTDAKWPPVTRLLGLGPHVHHIDARDSAAGRGSV